MPNKYHMNTKPCWFCSTVLYSTWTVLLRSQFLWLQATAVYRVMSAGVKRKLVLEVVIIIMIIIIIRVATTHSNGSDSFYWQALLCFLSSALCTIPYLLSSLFSSSLFCCWPPPLSSALITSYTLSCREGLFSLVSGDVSLRHSSRRHHGAECRQTWGCCYC